MSDAYPRIVVFDNKRASTGQLAGDGLSSDCCLGLSIHGDQIKEKKIIAFVFWVPVARGGGTPMTRWVCTSGNRLELSTQRNEWGYPAIQFMKGRRIMDTYHS